MFDEGGEGPLDAGKGIFFGGTGEPDELDTDDPEEGLDVICRNA